MHLKSESPKEVGQVPGGPILGDREKKRVRDALDYAIKKGKKTALPIEEVKAELLSILETKSREVPNRRRGLKVKFDGAQIWPPR